MYCLIVKRGDTGRCDLLYKAFGQKIPVIWERRRGERRNGSADTSIEEQRQNDRRGPPPPIWMALGFTVVNR